MVDRPTDEKREEADAEDEELLEQFGGTPTFPRGTSNTHRRRLLKAMGGAGTVALAGCLGTEEEEEEPTPTPTEEPDDETPTPTEEPDDEEEEEEYWAANPMDAYSELDHMKKDVRPDPLVKPVDIQFAFNDDEIIMRFEWDQPNEGGWLHDMIVYNGEEWVRYANWNPWDLDEDEAPPGGMDHHQGLYEDRLTFMWHDGTLQGFENFGGWMTVMEGVRRLPGEAHGDEVDAHPHHGTEGRDDGDMRKFIPQSRNGEWWEHDWRDPKSQDELDEMMENGEFIDFPFFRGHRSVPMGYGTNHHLLDYRNGNVTGDRTFGSQDWDPEDGPELMFDPDVVEDGALDYYECVVDNEPGPGIPDQQDFEKYALMTEGENENAVDFDPDVAEWEGAMVPRRPQGLPSESGASWECDAVWEDGKWMMEVRRDLDTGYVDDMPVEEGGVYTIAPAIHHGNSQRWHWVAYPYKLGLGVEPDYYGESDNLGNSELVAEKVEDEPDWDDIETYTIPLMYPGMTDWTWLTSGEHPRVDEVRNADITIWEYHDEDPEAFAQRMVELEDAHAPRK
ncbi:cytochrome c-552 precursor [Halalkaliarchaeum desulfuricum]|uniref:Cytochrome c-552 n=1 Tax=Halalkaliarchaeum desulfuricum TaxID=2055893 RepID=A0A343TNI7_9EURY|nr:ethylbenzene dehydrogenase-related protein [Halalkaliarchaeum desulfuricum]AUX10659.1 cytochrome c-552 precursor [Halalkaliarchaeum desulfuricum]